MQLRSRALRTKTDNEINIQQSVGSRKKQKVDKTSDKKIKSKKRTKTVQVSRDATEEQHPQDIPTSKQSLDTHTVPASRETVPERASVVETQETVSETQETVSVTQEIEDRLNDKQRGTTSNRVSDKTPKRYSLAHNDIASPQLSPLKTVHDDFVADSTIEEISLSSSSSPLKAAGYLPPKETSFHRNASDPFADIHIFIFFTTKALVNPWRLSEQVTGYLTVEVVEYIIKRWYDLTASQKAGFILSLLQSPSKKLCRMGMDDIDPWTRALATGVIGYLENGTFDLSYLQAQPFGHLLDKLTPLATKKLPFATEEMKYLQRHVILDYSPPQETRLLFKPEHQLPTMEQRMEKYGLPHTLSHTTITLSSTSTASFKSQASQSSGPLSGRDAPKGFRKESKVKMLDLNESASIGKELEDLQRKKEEDARLEKERKQQQKEQEIQQKKMQKEKELEQRRLAREQAEEARRLKKQKQDEEKQKKEEERQKKEQEKRKSEEDHDVKQQLVKEIQLGVKIYQDDSGDLKKEIMVIKLDYWSCKWTKNHWKHLAANLRVAELEAKQV
ncbi:hypothetical protein EDD86DRAFT_245466 [Gorgonomyces haynaldii]|nr:hypothetical protein EDD86DRAFT_245466 [Gorgonomyces haynaldii]